MSRPSCSGSLPAEEDLVQLARLRGRELRLRKNLHRFVRNPPLHVGKRRWVQVPAQAGPYVRLNPRGLAGDLVGKPMELAHLLEQRLELRIVDSHVRHTVRDGVASCGETAGGRMGRNLQGMSRPPQDSQPFTFRRGWPAGGPLRHPFPPGRLQSARVTDELDGPAVGRIT